ncbi:MAG: phosphatidylserine decarboxylase family protein, partial [Proteobacteria bacterium]|nr:phosphatidylserine decarboxylase family protein [Pseudomonadota bacterium]
MRAAVLKTVLVPIASDGWPFIGGLAILSLFTLWLFEPLGWAVVLSTLWCTYFFRDPDRVVPIRPGLIVSPADGVVQAITRATPPAEPGMGMHARPRISIFLNIFDVHVNRAPCDGEVTALDYRPGKFLNASLDKASIDNERQSIRLALNDGRDIAVVQIAGLIARRILCQARLGQRLLAGERFGMIRFGSRVDV